MKKDLIIAGLDIGSTKVVAIVGLVKEDGTLDVIGVGSAPSQGIRKGVVVNIEATTESILKAREEAELMAGVSIENVWLGVSGTHVSSFDSTGLVAIRQKEVTQADVDRVIEAAKTVAVPADRRVIHVIPREFKIDDQDGIYDPVGMTGVRLEALVHIITGGQTAIQNLVRCSEKAGLKVAGLVLQPIASAKAVLSDDERNLGVVLADIGGGTTDVIIYTQGSVAYTGCIPVGGSHISNDVAVGLRTPPANAELLKKKYGCAMASLVNESEAIDVEGVGGRKERSVLRQYLCEVIEPRVEEILNFINHEVQKSGLASLAGSGVVLTGGTSQIDGITELGEFVFDMPVQRSGPKRFGGLVDAVNQPSFATAVGLLMYALEKSRPDKTGKSRQLQNQNSKNSADRWLSRMKNLIDGAF